jgi:AcrR family transcriptional regulator
MSNRKRTYTSRLRADAAKTTRARILNAAKGLFTRNGIDKVTIEDIAKKAAVASPTIYASFKSKEGVLRGLMEACLFGDRYRDAQSLLHGVRDAVQLIRLTAHIARAIYDGESAEMGLLRGASAFTPALRKIEQDFEMMRFEMQEERVKLLFEQGKARTELTLAEARRILWMYTSRDVYRMLVQESGWASERYQEWLADTLVRALVNPEKQPRIRQSGFRNLPQQSRLPRR